MYFLYLPVKWESLRGSLFCCNGATLAGLFALGLICSYLIRANRIDNQFQSNSQPMESQARFLNIKTSRFKQDYKTGEALPQTPSANGRGLQHSPSLTTSFNHPAPHPLLHQPSKIAKITRFLSQQRGAHHPLSYHPSFGFSQKWEALSKQAQGRQMGFMQTSGRLQWASFALFPFLVVQLWFVTVFRVFRYESGGWMWPAGLALELLCLLQKAAVIVSELDCRGDIGHQLCALFNRERTIATAGNVYALCYYCVALGSGAVGYANLVLFLFDLLLICYKYLMLEQIYSGIRIQAVGSRYKVFMSLFDLFSNVVLMIHVFAVLLYLCTYASPGSNWHTTSPIDSKNHWIGDYIEAFYFACTTMLTVGFGDIRPTNLLEIFCVLIVQLVGILNNAYVINEIGVNLSLIHQRRNTLEKDIANAQKVIHFNRMSQQTRTRMLGYLMRNQVANEELSVADEEALLDKLSEEFKGEIKQDSQLRAVKKNVFLLANFTRRFQNEVSKRLIKTIYPPHSVLANHPGRERLFIISKGTVDIVTQKKYNNRAFAEKVVKSIEVKQCADNHYINATYGYACLFSGKPSRIKAVAKNFAVCYYLEHQDLLECMGRSTDDFERYFEIKHRVELLPLPEIYEISNIISKREHYCPNVYYLIKKERKSRHTQSRRYLYRWHRRLFKVHEKFQEELGAKSASINESTDSFPSVVIEETHQQQQQMQQHPLQRKATPLSNFSPQLLANLNTPLITKPRTQQQTRISAKQYMEMRKMKLQEKANTELNIQIFSETCKEYKNYNPKGNLTPILQRYNKRLNARNDTESDSMTSSRLAFLKSKRKRMELLHTSSL